MLNSATSTKPKKMMPIGIYIMILFSRRELSQIFSPAHISGTYIRVKLEEPGRETFCFTGSNFEKTNSCVSMNQTNKLDHVFTSRVCQWTDI